MKALRRSHTSSSNSSPSSSSSSSSWIHLRSVLFVVTSSSPAYCSSSDRWVSFCSSNYSSLFLLLQSYVSVIFIGFYSDLDLGVNWVIFFTTQLFTCFSGVFLFPLFNVLVLYGPSLMWFTKFITSFASAFNFITLFINFFVLLRKNSWFVE